MDYFPKFDVTRFEQLKSGDLFFIELGGVRVVALKAIDTQNDGDKLMVLLGPNFPTNESPGALAPRVAATVVSIGSNYSVSLSTDPSTWTVAPPAHDVVALYLQDHQLYVRANFGRPHDFQPCHVRMSDGEVVYGSARGIGAYVSQWEIAVADTGQRILGVAKSER